MSCETGRFSNEKFEMQYIKFGQGKKTLVILPGLSVQSVIPAAAAIEKQYEIFKNDFTVYLFDRRQNLPEVYSVYDMADDTAEAMAELGLTEACLFGVSQGGMIAQVIAAEHRELVSRLALASTDCRANETLSTALNTWLDLARNYDTEGLYLSFGEKVYSPSVFNEYKSFFVDTAKTATKADLDRFLILAKGISDFDATDLINKISCPVLVICDTDDRVLGSNVASGIEEQLKNKPGFHKYIYHGYGHAVYDTAPDFTERIFEFFNK